MCCIKFGLSNTQRQKRSVQYYYITCPYVTQGFFFVGEVFPW